MIFNNISIFLKKEFLIALQLESFPRADLSKAYLEKRATSTVNEIYRRIEEDPSVPRLIQEELLDRLRDLGGLCIRQEDFIGFKKIAREIKINLNGEWEEIRTGRAEEDEDEKIEIYKFDFLLDRPLVFKKIQAVQGDTKEVLISLMPYGGQELHNLLVDRSYEIEAPCCPFQLIFRVVSTYIALNYYALRDGKECVANSDLSLSNVTFDGEELHIIDAGGIGTDLCTLGVVPLSVQLASAEEKQCSALASLCLIMMGGLKTNGFPKGDLDSIRGDMERYLGQHLNERKDQLESLLEMQKEEAFIRKEDFLGVFEDPDLFCSQLYDNVYLNFLKLRAIDDFAANKSREYSSFFHRPEGFPIDEFIKELHHRRHSPHCYHMLVDVISAEEPSKVHTSWIGLMKKYVPQMYEEWPLRELEFRSCRD